MLYYSKTTGGFYDSTIHGNMVPNDAVEISAEQHSALLEGQSQGKLIVGDSAGMPILQDRPGPTVAELIASKRKAIEARREIEEKKGMPYTFPGPIDDVVQLRDDRDKLNITGQVTAALILKDQGETGSVMPFQAESNATHMLTPDEMIAMGQAVNSYCLGLYQTQWQQKALLDALDPATATEADIDAIADWPEI